MSKKMTRRERILKIVAEGHYFNTCLYLTGRICQIDGVSAGSRRGRNLIGSLSHVLRKMVVSGDLEIDPIFKGYRKGNCYILPKNKKV